jgi:hypothetical protein
VLVLTTANVNSIGRVKFELLRAKQTSRTIREEDKQSFVCSASIRIFYLFFLSLKLYKAQAASNSLSQAVEMASAREAIRKIDFIEKTLPQLIVERSEGFKDYEILNCRAELNKHLDGFMSAIYNVELTMKGPDESQ